MRTKKIMSMAKHGLEKEARRLISIMEENGVCTDPFTDVIEEVRRRPKVTESLRSLRERELLLEKLNKCLQNWREHRDPSAKLQALEEFEAAAQRAVELSWTRLILRLF